MGFRIILEKENFKFSCSHFTILGPDRAERLHGHNYYVRVEIQVESIDPALGMAFDINAVKPLVHAIVCELDERVLLPGQSPYLKVRSGPESVAAELGKKNYLFPSSDTRVLQVANITSEELARFIAIDLAERLRRSVKNTSPGRLSVAVEETRGQSIAYEMEL